MNDIHNSDRVDALEGAVYLADQQGNERKIRRPEQGQHLTA